MPVIVEQIAVDDLSELVELNLLTEKEQEWLAAATIGTRPLLVVSWLLELFDSIKAAGYFCVCYLLYIFVLYLLF